ncbi:pre-mRNA-splicing factor Rse1p [Monosporozyma servazzii]
MLIQESDLVLYNLTLQKQSNYIFSCTGNFVNIDNSNNNNLQLCLATENHIELYNLSNRSLQKIGNDIPFFAIMKNIKPLRNHTSNIDYLIITSDSGNLSILKFIWNSDSWQLSLSPLSIEPIARSGTRRLSPIEYIAIDKQSRCIMISAIEKFKYCYLINTNNTQNIISSPLEAIRSNFITLDLVSCDMGYIDNPCFASLEMEIVPPTTSTAKTNFHLVFYMMDLNLNCIVKKADYLSPGNPNMLIPLPDLSEYGISTNINDNNNNNNTATTNPFIIIAIENSLLIKDLKGYYNIKVPLPKCKDHHSTTLITSYSFRSFKKKLFILLQSNYGDLFKLQIIPNQNDANKPKCIINYFDTIPVVEQLHITTNGLLFANSESHTNYLFQFESLGGDEPMDSFTVSNVLQNLSILKQNHTLNPMLAATIATKNDGSNQPLVPLKLLTNNQDSIIRSYTNSVDIETLISSPLPPAPKNIWTLKRTTDDTFHSYVTLAFNNYTVFLNISGDSMQTLAFQDPSPFVMKNDMTIYMATLKPNILIQVCSNQFTQVATTSEASGFKQIHEWFPPAGIQIVSATATASQLIIALSNNNILYFEVKGNGTNLIESSKILTMESKIIKLAVDQDKFRCDHLVVATDDDNLISIISLDTSSSTFMEILSFQQLNEQINDVVMNGTTFYVGLQNGIYVKSKFASKEGEILNTNQKFMGTKPIRLSVIDKALLTLQDEDENSDDEEDDSDDDGNDEKKSTVQEKEHSKSEYSRCIVIHSDNIWLDYKYKQMGYIRPISLAKDASYLNKVIQFSTSTISNNGICALSASGTLIIGKMKNFINTDAWFNIQDVKLSNNEDRKKDEDEENEDDEEEEEEEEEQITSQEYQNKIALPVNNGEYTLFISNHNNTASPKCRISIISSTADQVILDSTSHTPFYEIEGHQLISAQIVNFTKNKNFVNLVISTRDQQLLTFQLKFEILKKGTFYTLTLLHKTKVESSVFAMSTINNRLFATILDFLIIYDLGKKQLLKKSITKVASTTTATTAIDVWDNNRIAIGDVHESVTIYQYDSENSKLYPIADDIVKRHVTSLKFIDANTIIGGDRFGNLWTLRIPAEVDESMIMKDVVSPRNNVMEAPFKLELKNHFFINDIPMWYSSAISVQMSDRPSIIYGGLQGTIGILTPLLSKLQIKTVMKLQEGIVNLESLIISDKMSKMTIDNKDEDGNKKIEEYDGEVWTNRNTKDELHPEGYTSLVDRDHLSYRSYYAPVKNVIDGDLCERFLILNSYEQALICKTIGKKTSIDEVINLLNEIRSNYM